MYCDKHTTELCNAARFLDTLIKSSKFFFQRYFRDKRKKTKK